MSRRAVMAGAALTVVLAVVTPYSDLRLNGTWLAACHLPVGAFFCFLLIVLLLNPLLGRLHRRLALSSGEVTTIYAMTLVGAGIPSFGLTAYLIPTLVGAGYFATPENLWAQWFYRFVPQWLVPFDLSRLPGSPVPALPPLYQHIPPVFHPAGPELLTQFYEGIPASRAIPWEPWAVPLAAWTALALCFFVCCWGLAAILRRQWVEGERLTFPLVQLPLALVEGHQPGRLPPFLRQPAVWAGFAIPQLVHLTNGLHSLYPAVPQIPLRFDLTAALGPQFGQVGIFWLWLHFSVIGLTFLLPADFSFSLWFFYLLFKLEGLLLVQLGHQVPFMRDYPVPKYAGLQMLGAFTVLSGYLFYAARPHLRGVWQRIVGRGGLDDSPEPSGYRTAGVGLVLGLLGAAGVLGLAGLPLGLGVLAVALTLMVILVLTRMIAEGGLLFVQAPFRPTDMIGTFADLRGISPRGLTVLAYFERIVSFDVRACLQPSLMDAFRLADGPGLNRRRLSWALWLAILLAVVTSYAATLHTAYRYGAVTGSPWFMIGSPQQPFGRLVAQLSTPVEVNPADAATVGLGAGVMLLLCIARNRLAGFAFHPLGFAMGPSWPLIQLWFSLFCGWGLKVLVLRSGGMKGYRRAYPFFLGLVLGEFCAAGLWVIIGMATGTSYRFLLT